MQFHLITLPCNLTILRHDDHFSYVLIILCVRMNGGQKSRGRCSIVSMNNYYNRTNPGIVIKEPAVPNIKRK